MVKGKEKNNSYSAQLKVEVVETYLNGEGSYKSIAEKFNLPNRYLVRDWVKIHKRQGFESLMVERRGRNSKGRAKSNKLEDMSLEEQVKYLKMENDILKKAKAFLKD